MGGTRARKKTKERGKGVESGGQWKKKTNERGRGSRCWRQTIEEDREERRRKIKKQMKEGGRLDVVDEQLKKNVRRRRRAARLRSDKRLGYIYIYILIGPGWVNPTPYLPNPTNRPIFILFYHFLNPTQPLRFGLGKPGWSGYRFFLTPLSNISNRLPYINVMLLWLFIFSLNGQRKEIELACYQ